MKTKLSILLLLISSMLFAQNPTAFTRLKVTGASKSNTATRVIVQDSITKEYKWVLKSSIGSSQLEKLNEGNGFGYRILERNPANYGNIGLNAIDLGYSENASAIRGATGNYSAVSGGFNNQASGFLSTVGGGDDNRSTANATTISGGQGNAASSNHATISGGEGNIASNIYASILGGEFNEATGERSTVTGGSYNVASGGSSSILGGGDNVASGFGSSVLGYSNSASGAYSSVLGGSGNTASGTLSNATGVNNTSRSYGEFALGVYGTDYTPVSTTSYNTADRLFNIGNGSSNISRSDALTIYKSGRAKFGDVIGLKAYTVSTLPVGTVGDTAYVTDATAPTYLGTLTGGGSVRCPVFHNGTNWVSH